MLFFLRAMFGFGMGGEWAAGMPLVLEHWPARLRGVVSGVLQGAFSWGFILAALVFHVGYPLLGPDSSVSWRAMLWSGIVPALLVVWIRRGVAESPLWLAIQADRSHGGLQQTSDRAPAAHGAVQDLLRAEVVRVAIVLAAIMVAYQSMSFWYATLLRQDGLAPLPYLVALNLGGLVGAATWGFLADTRLGHRGAISLASGLSVLLVPLFLYGEGSIGHWLGALLTGLTGAGVIGVAPAYVGRHFPTASRATGWGVVYHTAAATGAIAPYVLGALQDAGWSLRGAMATAIAGAGGLAVALVWTGPREPPRD
jgi:MFS transporter, SHS family, lactate transporter